MKKLITFVFLLFVLITNGQNIGISASSAFVPSDCSMLDISSTTKGLLIPRVSLTNVITYLPLTGTAVDGMMVYSITSPTNGGGTGYYYWSTTSSKWINLVDNLSPGSPWLVGGNSFAGGSGYNIGTLTNDYVDLYSNNVARGRILSTGEFLFGSTSFIAPAMTGDKASAFITSATNSWAFNGVNTSTSGGSIYADNTNVSNDYNAIEGITNGTYSGVYGLHITNTGAGYGVYAATNSTSTTSQGLYAKCPYADNSGNYAGYFYGRVITTANYYTTSDERLKTNITDMTGCLKNILKLRPVNYYFKEEYRKFVGNAELQSGFIAQDLECIFPSLVSDVMLSYDNNTKSKNNTKTEYFSGKAISTNGLIPHIVKAIQEQQQMIDSLKEEIRILKDK